MSTTTSTVIRFVHVPNMSAAMKKEDAAPPSKTRKGSRASLEGAKKPRGRPRLEPHDETAADRRRTQIRLAQRAYRQRKETTIIALRQRVSELKQNVDQMQRAFTTFGDKAMAAGLQDANAELAHDLKETVQLTSRLFDEAKVDQEENFDDAAPKSPKQESDDGVDGVDGADSPASDSNPSKSVVADAPPLALPALDQPNPSDSMWDSNMVWESTDPGQTQAGSSALPTDLTPTSGFDRNMPAWMEPFMAHSTDDESSERSDDDRHWQMSLLGDLSVFAPELTSHLPLPHSGALDELTFARRLHRATLERGVHIIQGGRLRPRAFMKQFQICLPFCDRAQLLLKIQDMLARGAQQPLDWSEHPLVHLGGAGLHYQDQTAREPTSNSKINDVRVRAIGPSTLALLMNATEQDNTMGKALDIAGFEGEWFSPNDVEGYLAEKGVNIDPGARVQEVVAPEDPAQTLPMMDAEKERRHSPQRSSLDYMQLGDESDHTPSSTPGRRASTQASTAPSSNVWERGGRTLRQHDQAAVSDVERTLSARQFVERRTVWVDIDRLVKELVNRATCIGRTPGYRRRDVDVAFAKSVAAH